MSRAPNITDDPRDAVKSVLNDLAPRLQLYTGKVMELDSVEPGLIQVFSISFNPFADESDSTTWIPVWPAQFSVNPPNVGDYVLFRFKSFTEDILLYEAMDPILTERAITGSDKKVIFEYKSGSDTYAIYFDTTNLKFTIQAGSETIDIDTNGIITQKDIEIGGNATIVTDFTVQGDSTVEGNSAVQGDETVDGDVTILNGSTPKPLSTHTHATGAPGAPTGPIQ